MLISRVDNFEVSNCEVSKFETEVFVVPVVSVISSVSAVSVISVINDSVV